MKPMRRRTVLFLMALMSLGLACGGDQTPLTREEFLNFALTKSPFQEEWSGGNWKEGTTAYEGRVPTDLVTEKAPGKNLLGYKLVDVGGDMQSHSDIAKEDYVFLYIETPNNEQAQTSCKDFGFDERFNDADRALDDFSVTPGEPPHDQLRNEPAIVADPAHAREDWNDTVDPERGEEICRILRTALYEGLGRSRKAR